MIIVYKIIPSNQSFGYRELRYLMLLLAITIIVSFSRHISPLFEGSRGSPRCHALEAGARQLFAYTVSMTCLCYNIDDVI